MNKKVIEKTALIELVKGVLKETKENVNPKTMVSDDANRKDIYKGMIIGIQKVLDNVRRI